MNCKPGDLAVVIKGSYCPQFIGHIVKVTTLEPVPWKGHWWRTDPEKRHGPFLVLFADDTLRPIRPPGLEDETPTDQPIKEPEHA